MKKIGLMLIAFVMLMLPVTAAEIWWGSLYSLPNVLISGTAGWEGSANSGIICISPGAEWLFYKPVMGNSTPLDIGAGARLRTGAGIGDTQGFYLGLGAGITVHFGFNGLGTSMGMPLLDNTEIFSEIGVCADLLKPDTENMFGLMLRSGARYMLFENLLAEAAYTTWRGANGFAIGVTLRLGKGQQVSALKTVIPVTEIKTNAYLAQFQSFYWLSIAPGGFYFDDSTYKEGDGTSWVIRSNEDQFTIDRSLIKANADGSKQWKIKITTDSDTLIYEFLLNKEREVKKLVFKNPDTGEIMTLVTEGDKNAALYGQGTNMVSSEQYNAWKQGKETIKVKAGTFQTDYIKYEVKEDKITYEWWMHPTTPGRLIQYKWKDAKDNKELNGELVKIMINEKSELNAF